MQVNGHEVHPGIFFGQIAEVLFGLFLILLGAAILYSIAYWRLHGQQVEGVILGIRRQGTQIRNVYQYAQPDGGLRQATSLQGDSSAKSHETGRRVNIRVRADHPDQAHEATAPVVWALACGLVLGGGWLTYDAVTEWKHSPITWILLALFAMYVGRKIWRWLARHLTKLQSRVGASDGWSTLPIEAAETLGPNRMQISGANPGWTRAIFCIIGLLILANAYLPARNLLSLRSGTRTQGTVVGLQSYTTAKRNTRVSATVEFTNADGTIARFQHSSESNIYRYKVGDHVTVLYQPGKPNTAMIDRGLRNWEPVVFLLLFGTVFTSLAFLSPRGRDASANQGIKMGTA